jgi:hypothetical protein
MLKMGVGALCVLGAAGLTGCVSGPRSPFMPPPGILVTAYKAPLTTNYDGTAKVANEGRASSYFVRDILLTGQTIAWDDCSIEAAAQNGALRQVAYADYEYFQVLGIFGKMTVIAHGTK